METNVAGSQDMAGPVARMAEREDLIRRLIVNLGEDPDREGLLETPARVARAYNELLGGYDMNPEEILGKTFAEGHDEIIILRDITFQSLCEHHLLPFTGRVHIGYLPNRRVVGISKLARVVDCFARRLQIQERLTEQIAHVIDAALEPMGVGVIVEAQHQCMTSRGVKNPSAVMVTSCLLGIIRYYAKDEFLRLVGK